MYIKISHVLESNLDQCTDDYLSKYPRTLHTLVSCRKWHHLVTIDAGEYSNDADDDDYTNFDEDDDNNDDDDDENIYQESDGAVCDVKRGNDEDDNDNADDDEDDDDDDDDDDEDEDHQ